VVNAIEARENEINGGDDDGDIDLDTPAEARPNQRDVLKAVSTIGRYIDDMNDPMMCLLDVQTVRSLR
jgi:hypothetical protein